MSDGPRGLVFRDGATRVDGAALRDEALAALRLARTPARDEATLLAALLRAGAWECALCDAGGAGAGDALAVTDAIADAYLGGGLQKLAGLDALVAAIAVPAQVRVAVPEGFAYYALHPREVARAAVDAGVPGPVLVVGVRTIGATLSAVVRAAFARQGEATRLTVRPTGHPYDRTVTLSPDDQARVRAVAAAGGSFVVVDEGPGLSGSSFLAAAEALEAAGAPAARTVLLGSRAVDPSTLVARDAAARWVRFRSVVAETGARSPEDAALGLSGGAWRYLLVGAPATWPASWASMERLKYQSGDGRWLLKFEGLGPYGAACHARAVMLGEAGIGPRPEGPLDENGFVRYPMLDGRALSRDDLDDELVATLAGYCARRAAMFPLAAADEAALQEMTAENVRLAVGRALPDTFALRCERPAFVDGRMMPWEWVRTDRALFKTDAVAHGDDHFYPGPTDIAWDLAGAAVEWDVPPARLAELYGRACRDDVRARLPAFVVSYAAFRAAQCGMAAHGGAADERARLLAARHGYVRALEAALAAFG